MRALAIVARDAAPAVIDVPSPDPGPGEVRVAVEAASVNGFDLAVAAGYVWDALPHVFPVVLGRDFAGTVESVGDGVDDVAVGERVCGVVPGMSLTAGAIAERLTVAATAVLRIPSTVTSVQAAAVGLAGVAALDIVTVLDVTADDVVLVSGAAGGVGAFVVQLVAARGAQVIATARPGEPSDFARRLGASQVVDYTADLTAAVGAAAPDGVTKIVHAAGDAATLAALLAAGGPLASVLGATPEQVGRGDVTVTPVLAAPTRQTLTWLLDAVATGRLTVPVRTLPLERAVDALRDFTTGTLGKIG